MQGLSGCAIALDRGGGDVELGRRGQDAFSVLCTPFPYRRRVERLGTTFVASIRRCLRYLDAPLLHFPTVQVVGLSLGRNKRQHSITGRLVDGVGRRAAANESLPAPALQVPAPRAKPWEDLSHGSKGLNLPMSAELYAKMRWCNENVPKMPLQKLARMGAEKLADELIAQHYKGE